MSREFRWGEWKPCFTHVNVDASSLVVNYSTHVSAVNHTSNVSFVSNVGYLLCHSFTHVIWAGPT